ncbi:MAG: DUF5320 domain-containing protein [Syntrophobacteraceae bacterium]
MPGFDRTGPSGAGPMTGGMRGFCTESGRRGAGNRSANPGLRGRGRGCRNRFFATGLTGWQRSAESGVRGGLRGFAQGLDLDIGFEADLDTLRARAGYFEKILDRIRRSIQRLESGT